jgi:hypothetical protein
MPRYVRSGSTRDCNQPCAKWSDSATVSTLGQPDNSYLRMWELAGASHIDLHAGSLTRTGHAAVIAAAKASGIS